MSVVNKVMIYVFLLSLLSMVLFNIHELYESFCSRKTDDIASIKRI